MPRGGARTGSGGKRKGAGRRPGSGGLERKTALKIAAPLIYGKSATEAGSAASILASIDEKAKWLELLEAGNVVAVAVVGEKERQSITVPDWNTRRQALEYLTDQRDGKAKQRVEQTVDDKRDPATRLRELFGIPALPAGATTPAGSAEGSAKANK